MAFMKVGAEPLKKKQRLYVLEIVMPSGMTVVKVGKASGVSSKERMLQICSSIYDKHRRTPMIKICRDREVDADKVFAYETIMHQFLADYHYNPKTKFDGSGECFVVPVGDVISAYELVIAGEVPDFKYKLPEVEADELPF